MFELLLADPPQSIRVVAEPEIDPLAPELRDVFVDLRDEQAHRVRPDVDDRDDHSSDFRWRVG